MTTLDVQHAASFWYPVMVSQEHGSISQSKAAELLGLSQEEYVDRKLGAIEAVMAMIESLPSPLISLLDLIEARQSGQTGNGTSSNSKTARKGKSCSRKTKS